MNKSCRMENNNDQSRGRKIFVGGLSADLTEDDFKNYFEKFGRITDVVVMHDSVTNRPRGFGFITFDSAESVDSVLQNNFHELNGRRVEVKRAVPKKGNCISGGHTSNPRARGGKSPLLPNGNVPPPYPYYGSGYVLYPGYTPFPHYGGPGVDLYGSSPYGSWYPPGLYGIGHGVFPMAPGGAWYVPNSFGVGMFPPPYRNSLIHPTYSSKGASFSDTAAGNAIADTRRSVERKQTIHGNRNMSADAVPFQIKDRA